MNKLFFAIAIPGLAATIVYLFAITDKKGAADPILKDSSVIVWNPKYSDLDTINVKILKQYNMKQCVLKFPMNKSKEVAKFLAENGIVTNLSYAKGDDFFNNEVIAIICFPDDKEDKVKANLQRYIQEGK